MNRKIQTQLLALQKLLTTSKDAGDVSRFLHAHHMRLFNRECEAKEEFRRTVACGDMVVWDSVKENCRMRGRVVKLNKKSAQVEIRGEPAPWTVPLSVLRPHNAAKR